MLKKKKFLTEWTTRRITHVKYCYENETGQNVYSYSYAGMLFLRRRRRRLMCAPLRALANLHQSAYKWIGSSDATKCVCTGTRTTLDSARVCVHTDGRRSVCFSLPPRRLARETARVRRREIDSRARRVWLIRRPAPRATSCPGVRAARWIWDISYFVSRASSRDPGTAGDARFPVRRKTDARAPIECV